MGGQFVAHSFRLLFNNLGNALKVSLGPYLIAIVVCVVVLGMAGVPFQLLAGGAVDPQALAQAGGGFFLALIVCLVVLLFVSSWVAVAWHRFVLLEEYPGMLPGLAGRPVWPYLGRVLLLTIVLILIAIPLSFVAGLVMIPFMSGGSGAGFVIGIIYGVILAAVLTWIWMRFGLVLPATSVEKPMSMGDSWSQTKRISGSIFGAVLILMALNIVVSALFGFVLGQNIVTTILSLIVDWISIMIGISILTTIYGHIVENRPLD